MLVANEEGATHDRTGTGADAGTSGGRRDRDADGRARAAAANPQELFGSLSLSAIEADIDRLMSDKMSQLDGMLAALRTWCSGWRARSPTSNRRPMGPIPPRGSSAGAADPRNRGGHRVAAIDYLKISGQPTPQAHVRVQESELLTHPRSAPVEIPSGPRVPPPGAGASSMHTSVTQATVHPAPQSNRYRGAVPLGFLGRSKSGRHRPPARELEEELPDEELQSYLAALAPETADAGKTRPARASATRRSTSSASS